MAQDGPKMAQDAPKMAQDDPEMGKDGPKMRQNRPKMLQDSSRMAPDDSKLSIPFPMGGIPEARRPFLQAQLFLCSATGKKQGCHLFSLT